MQSTKTASHDRQSMPELRGKRETHGVRISRIYCCWCLELLDGIHGIPHFTSPSGTLYACPFPPLSAGPGAERGRRDRPRRRRLSCQRASDYRVRRCSTPKQQYVKLGDTPTDVGPNSPYTSYRAIAKGPHGGPSASSTTAAAASTASSFFSSVGSLWGVWRPKNKSRGERTLGNTLLRVGVIAPLVNSFRSGAAATHGPVADLPVLYQFPRLRPSLPKLTDVAPILATSGQLWPKVNRAWPMLARC